MSRAEWYKENIFSEVETTDEALSWFGRFNWRTQFEMLDIMDAIVHGKEFIGKWTNEFNMNGRPYPFTVSVNVKPEPSQKADRNDPYFKSQTAWIDEYNVNDSKVYVKVNRITKWSRD